MIAGEFARGEKDKLVVSVREYEGRPYIDCRIYFLGTNGEWLPTKKGITVRTNEMHNFSDAIEKSIVELERRPRR